METPQAAALAGGAKKGIDKMMQKAYWIAAPVMYSLADEGHLRRWPAGVGFRSQQERGVTR